MRNPALACLALAGCMVGPDYERPAIDVPREFRNAEGDGESIATLPWWEVFEDATLRSLIEIALENNQDVGIALERIAEARAILGFTRADLGPSFGYSATAGRIQPGEQLFGNVPATSQFDVSADVFWELDLWGKLRRSNEAARNDLYATEWAWISSRISLIADVAESYMLLLDLDAQLAITKRTLQTRRDATRIISDRFGEGVVAALDVHQAEIEEATAEVAVAQLERQITQTEHALRLLLGEAPGDIPRGDGPAHQLAIEIPTGIPGELLQRRPDILVAEHLAAAQTSRIGVAEAMRLPSVTLGGTVGSTALDADNLFTAPASSWSIGGAIAGPLFEWGKNLRRVEIEEARARQALLEYEATVLRAFREVDDALVAVRTFRMEHRARQMQVDAAREAARLSRALYDDQFTSYLEVLTAERSLFDAELAESAAFRQSLQATVRLYRALGGGWVVPDGESGD